MKKAGEESPAVETHFSTNTTIHELLGSVKQNFQTVAAQLPDCPSPVENRCQARRSLPTGRLHRTNPPSKPDGFRFADDSELFVGAGNLIPPLVHPRSPPAGTIAKIS